MSTHRKRCRAYDQQARCWLQSNPLVKPEVAKVVKLVEEVKDFDIVSVGELARMIDFAQDLEACCDTVLKGTYQCQNELDIFRTMEQWRRYANQHLVMFRLPNIKQLDKQLTAHYRWFESHLWQCRQHEDTYGQPILDDDVESTRQGDDVESTRQDDNAESTRQDDDVPPNGEYFTCIRTTLVRPPRQGRSRMPSSAITTSRALTAFGRPTGADARSATTTTRMGQSTGSGAGTSAACGLC